MDAGAPGSELKTSLARSVRIEAGCVVKRFESKALGRDRDRPRALREFELLSALHSRGARVPRPLSLERRGAGWEVAMEHVPDARALDAWLRAGSLPIAPEMLMRRLAELLAELQALGLDHPDLHAGNVLVDRHGAVRAIDFHKARLRGTLSARALADALVQLEAGTREHLAARLRARFLLRWLAALPAELARKLPSRQLLAQRVEAEGRARRARAVERRRRRWTRASSSCRPLEGMLRGFARADLPDDVPGRVARMGVSGSGWTLAAGSDSAAEPSLLLLAGQGWGALLDAWYAAARLEEQRVPVAGPLVLLRSPVKCAAFALLPGAGPGATEPPAAGLASALGTLAGILLDRGLWVAPAELARARLDAAGRAYLAGVRELRRAPRSRSAAAREWMRSLGLDAGARVEFSHACARALQIPRAERERLLADLLHG